MDPWTATVDYGDGSGAAALALSGTGFALAHTYPSAGVFTVTVSVSDGHATTTATQAVTVISQAQAVRDVIAQINLLAASGKIRRSIAIALVAELDVAAHALDARLSVVAVVVLDVVYIEIGALAKLGRIPASDAQTLRASISRIVASVVASGIRR
jgi:hypothetical protein